MNRSITMSFPHELSQPEARRRVEAALGQLGQQLTTVKFASLRQSWQGDRMSFVAQVLGQDVSGHVDVLPETVGIEVTLPAILALLADVVKGRLQTEGRKLLARDAGK